MSESKHAWNIRSGKVTKFLGIHITQSATRVTIDRQACIKKVLQCFQITIAKIAPTPLLTGYNPIENTEPVNPVWCQRYQQVIGSLLYLMLGTWPDITYAVIKLSQFSVNPSQIHLDKVMYNMHYLVGTQHYKIVYNGKVAGGLIAFTDSDWAADETKCCSTTGYFTVLASSSVCWQSHLQKIVVLSSTEAKYMTLSDTSWQIA